MSPLASMLEELGEQDWSPTDRQTGVIPVRGSTRTAAPSRDPLG